MNDFWGDVDVRAMTHIQRSYYRTLLLDAFLCPKFPFLPDDDNYLWKIADASSLAMWKKNSGPVRAKFIPFLENGVALLRNPILDKEWARIKGHSENARKGGL